MSDLSSERFDHIQKEDWEGSPTRNTGWTPSELLAMPGMLSAEEAAQILLTKTTGLDTTSPHGKGTPARFVKMLQELTTPTSYQFTCFEKDADSDEMIVLEKIPFVSVCNHHVIPFIGHAYIGYIPDKSIAGLSKFARLVRSVASQLQVQERLTQQIADLLDELLDPLGVAVLIRAEHMCMTIRGVQTPGTLTTTSAMKGVFADHTRTAKAEFMQIITPNF